jgi:hypothetical protein
MTIGLVLVDASYGYGVLDLIAMNPNIRAWYLKNLVAGDTWRGKSRMYG